MNTLLVCLVIGIVDGDTLTALCNGTEQIKIRLAEIDAPEKNQSFGSRSKQSLFDMCFHKKAVIRPLEKDYYERTVAKISCDGLDVNKEQIKRGMAWVYDKYVRDKSLYSIQDRAQVSRTGLWVEDNPIKPWEYRSDMKIRKAYKKMN
ncbi:MAG: nuclease [Nitrosomonadaceae bacterium]|nr:nuclease [Nitrosomonadaceae bacterium]|tara:strand:+ start:844 stop:1287 length:444 start_codon:yes stop_codon:yes gene_type:complete